MGQAEIIEVLEKLNKPSSRGEIAKVMDTDPIKVSHWLAKLVKHAEVMIQEIGYEDAWKYKCRRGLKLYYIKSEQEDKNGRTKTTTRRTEITTSCKS